MIEDVTLVDTNLPDGWIISDALQEAGPTLTISVVASLFFARSPEWLRHHEREGLMVDDEVVEIPRTESGDRAYRLHTIERVAHALASKGVVDVRQLSGSLVMVKVIAQIHGLML